MTTTRDEAQDENIRLRAALAQSKSPCVYCSLPAEDWAKCQHGFPGCDRADDAMGCPELGQRMRAEDAENQVTKLKGELDEANYYVGEEQLIARHDSWVLRNEVLEAQVAALTAERDNLQRERDKARQQLTACDGWTINTMGQRAEAAEARADDAEAQVAKLEREEAIMQEARDDIEATGAEISRMRGKALADVAAERRRQVEGEGWTAEHDDAHATGEMAIAAGLYALNASRFALDFDSFGRGEDYPVGWPWHRSWWKPKNRRRDIVRAAALLVAEIERLDRLATVQVPEDRKQPVCDHAGWTFAKDGRRCAKCGAFVLDFGD